MKRYIISSVLALSSQSFAYPSVHDYASYLSLTTAKDGTVTRNEQDIEIAEFDPGSNRYREAVSTTVENQAQKEEVWTNASDMIFPQDIQNVLANCATNGGHLIAVTVPAGTFNTCASSVDHPDGKGTDWLGDVPFGVVKSVFEKKDGSGKSEYQLQSFR